jgi:hypothetical protein
MFFYFVKKKIIKYIDMDMNDVFWTKKWTKCWQAFYNKKTMTMSLAARMCGMCRKNLETNTTIYLAPNGYRAYDVTYQHEYIQDDEGVRYCCWSCMLMKKGKLDS